MFLEPKGVPASVPGIRSSSFLVFVLLRFGSRRISGAGCAAAVRAGFRAIIDFVRSYGTQRRGAHRVIFRRWGKCIRWENTQRVGGSGSGCWRRRRCNLLPGYYPAGGQHDSHDQHQQDFSGLHKAIIHPIPTIAAAQSPIVHRPWSIVTPCYLAKPLSFEYPYQREWLGPGGLPGLQHRWRAAMRAAVGSTPIHSRLCIYWRQQANNLNAACCLP